MDTPYITAFPPRQLSDEPGPTAPHQAYFRTPEEAIAAIQAMLEEFDQIDDTVRTLLRIEGRPFAGAGRVSLHLEAPKPGETVFGGRILIEAA